MAQIVDLMKVQVQRTHVFAVLDTLEYLRRSGRMNRVIAALGSWLQVKPLLKMYDGNPTVEKVRTARAAKRRLVALLGEQAPLEKVALVHTHALGKAQDLCQ
jgi:fatty acid-binding protein DegV